MSIRVVGLDLSVVATGLAKPDGSTITIRPNATSHEPARRLNQIVARLDPYLRLGVDLAIIEGYSRGGPGGPHVMLRLAEVGGAVRLRLFELGIPYIEIPPSQLKKFATGSGAASKVEMLAAALDGGADVANDNEADAWHLYSIGRSQFSETWDPGFKRVELVEVRQKIREAIKWPALEVRT
jgi:Holliday junction resolvasome RuvABC endonuclease subunit